MQNLGKSYLMALICVAITSLYWSCNNENHQPKKKQKISNYLIPAKEFKWTKVEDDSSRSFAVTGDTLITGKPIYYVIQSGSVIKREINGNIYVFFTPAGGSEEEADINCDYCCYEYPESCGGSDGNAQCYERCSNDLDRCLKIGGGYECLARYTSCISYCRP